MRKRTKKPSANNAKAKEVKDERTVTQDRSTGAMSSLNDLSWYSRYPDLLIAGASFPYPYRPGMRTGKVFDVDVDAIGATANDINFITVPGVMSLDWVPSVGSSTSVLDPASIVAKELFARVRSSFSGSLAADPPDFVIYLMALDSIYSYLAWLKRVNRTVSTFSPDNRMVPEGVLMSMGFSLDNIAELQQRKMELFSITNELIKMSRKFTCPAVMDYFNRHYWMNDNVYTDAPSANSQFYVFNQTHWYKFALLPTPDSVQAGGLTLVELQIPSSQVVEYLYNFGKQLITALAESDDSYIISGYLMRAFEGTPSFTVADLEYGEIITPVYVEEVLSQIENSTAVPFPSGATYDAVVDGDVTQDPKTNRVLCAPAVSSEAASAKYLSLIHI